MNIFDQIEREQAHIKKIEDRLFDVKMIKLHTGIDGYNSPEVWGNYRADGGNCLGVVGNKYVPTQPKQVFEIFKDGLQEQGLPMDKMIYHEMKGGSKIRFSVPIGRLGFTNIRGEADETDVILNFQTGFDGLTKSTIFLSTLRLICTNGMKAVKMEWQLNCKNTRGNTGKILTAANEIRKAIAEIDNLDTMIKYLHSKEINREMIDNFFMKILGYNQKTVNKKGAQTQRRFDQINKSVALELSRTGNNLWGLVNGITHYTNHKQHLKKDGTERVSSDDNIFVGSGLTLNEKAQKIALAMAN